MAEQTKRAPKNLEPSQGSGGGEGADGQPATFPVVLRGREVAKESLSRGEATCNKNAKVVWPLIALNTDKAGS